mgnify:CR=1 FL=1
MIFVRLYENHTYVDTSERYFFKISVISNSYVNLISDTLFPLIDSLLNLLICKNNIFSIKNDLGIIETIFTFIGI